jgi:hypothetical protein
VRSFQTLADLCLQHRGRVVLTMRERLRWLRPRT